MKCGGPKPPRLETLGKADTLSVHLDQFLIINRKLRVSEDFR